MVSRVIATEEATSFIELLKEKHGPLLLYQSGGCCDGSVPICLAVGDMMLGDADVKLGEIAGCAFYMNQNQFEYWKHTQLIIDVKAGRGGVFSLESAEGKRFITTSRVFTEAEEEAQQG